MFKQMAGSKKRMLWEELFFLGKDGVPLEDKKTAKYEIPLECVRIAPSASNRQPWKIIKDKERNNYHFYLKKTKGYDKLFEGVSLQNIDMGIAMCHFELAVQELGLKGYWQTGKPHVSASNMECIASWMGAEEG